MHVSCRNVRIEIDEDQEAFDMSLNNGNKFFKGKSRLKCFLTLLKGF